MRKIKIYVGLILCFGILGTLFFNATTNSSQNNFGEKTLAELMPKSAVQHQELIDLFNSESNKIRSQLQASQKTIAEYEIKGKIESELKNNEFFLEKQHRMLETFTAEFEKLGGQVDPESIRTNNGKAYFSGVEIIKAPSEFGKMVQSLYTGPLKSSIFFSPIFGTISVGSIGSARGSIINLGGLPQSKFQIERGFWDIRPSSLAETSHVIFHEIGHIFKNLEMRMGLNCLTCGRVLNSTNNAYSNGNYSIDELKQAYKGFRVGARQTGITNDSTRGNIDRVIKMSIDVQTLVQNLNSKLNQNFIYKISELSDIAKQKLRIPNNVSTGIVVTDGNILIHMPEATDNLNTNEILKLASDYTARLNNYAISTREGIVKEASKLIQLDNSYKEAFKDLLSGSEVKTSDYEYRLIEYVEKSVKSAELNQKVNLSQKMQIGSVLVDPLPTVIENINSETLVKETASQVKEISTNVINRSVAEFKTLGVNAVAISESQIAKDMNYPDVIEVKEVADVKNSTATANTIKDIVYEQGKVNISLDLTETKIPININTKGLNLNLEVVGMDKIDVKLDLEKLTSNIARISERNGRNNSKTLEIEKAVVNNKITSQIENTKLTTNTKLPNKITVGKTLNAATNASVLAATLADIGKSVGHVEQQLSQEKDPSKRVEILNKSAQTLNNNIISITTIGGALYGAKKLLVKMRAPIAAATMETGVGVVLVVLPITYDFLADPQNRKDFKYALQNPKQSYNTIAQVVQTDFKNIKQNLTNKNNFVSKGLIDDLIGFANYVHEDAVDYASSVMEQAFQENNLTSTPQQQVIKTAVKTAVVNNKINTQKKIEIKDKVLSATTNLKPKITFTDDEEKKLVKSIDEFQKKSKNFIDELDKIKDKGLSFSIDYNGLIKQFQMPTPPPLLKKPTFEMVQVKDLFSPVGSGTNQRPPFLVDKSGNYYGFDNGKKINKDSVAPVFSLGGSLVNFTVAFEDGTTKNYPANMTDAYFDKGLQSWSKLTTIKPDNTTSFQLGVGSLLLIKNSNEGAPTKNYQIDLSQVSLIKLIDEVTANPKGNLACGAGPSNLVRSSACGAGPDRSPSGLSESEISKIFFEQY